MDDTDVVLLTCAKTIRHARLIPIPYARRSSSHRADRRLERLTRLAPVPRPAGSRPQFSGAVASRSALCRRTLRSSGGALPRATSTISPIARVGSSQTGRALGATQSAAEPPPTTRTSSPPPSQQLPRDCKTYDDRCRFVSGPHSDALSNTPAS
jgi:hypothetical protein